MSMPDSGYRQLLMRRHGLPFYELQMLERPPALPDVRIRRAEIADEPALAELLTSAFGKTWTPEDVAKVLTRNATVDTVFVAEQGGKLLATASARVEVEEYPCEGYLHWVATAPEARHQGLGRAVCLAVLQRFMELGYSSVVLETDDDRLDAIRLYMRLGFQPVMRDLDDLDRWFAITRRILEE